MQVIINNKELIYFIFTLACSIVLFILSIIIKIKNSKGAPVQDELKLINLVKILAIEAENFKNYSGPEKYAYVMTRVKNYCVDNNIIYNEEFIDDQLESLISTTKLINKD